MQEDGAFHKIVLKVKDRIIKSFNTEALDLFEREFRFFEKVTNISGVLYPLPKDKRRAGIRRYSHFEFTQL
jgi:phosphatidylinositol 4-kinase